MFLVGVTENGIVATVMGGYEGHRGWINYLAVRPSEQRKGYGQAVMQAVEALIEKKGCPKINLQVRNTNEAAIAFYLAIGYGNDNVIGLGKRLGHDSQQCVNKQLQRINLRCAPIAPRYLSYQEYEDTPSGVVEVHSIELFGRRFAWMSAGSGYKMNEAISFVLDCEGQDGVDYYWEALTVDGGMKSQRAQRRLSG